MITVSNTAPVTLTPGQAMTFNSIIWKSGCIETFRKNSSAIRAGIGVFEVNFSGNISSATGGVPAQLNIELDGAPLPETTMISTPATADIFNNVSNGTTVGNQRTCCNSDPGSISLTVVNTGTGNLTVDANSKFSIKRIAG